MILIAKFKEISGPFILGKLAQNLKRTSLQVYRSGRETSCDWNRFFFLTKSYMKNVSSVQGGLKKEELEKELEEE